MTNKSYNVQYEEINDCNEMEYTQLLLRNNSIDLITFTKINSEPIEHIVFPITEKNIDDLILSLCNVKAYYMNIKGHE